MPEPEQSRRFCSRQGRFNSIPANLNRSSLTGRVAVNVLGGYFHCDPPGRRQATTGLPNPQAIALVTLRVPIQKNRWRRFVVCSTVSRHGRTDCGLRRVG
jgi:hypothetical protein